MFKSINLLSVTPLNVKQLSIKQCHGVIVIIIGNGHSDTNSNPGPG